MKRHHGSCDTSSRRASRFSRSVGHHGDGFTLLEVMVAMAILAGSLTLLLESQMQSARASQRSRMITTAVLLARTRMADLEHELYQDGFSEIGFDSSGDFADEGFPRFRWEWKVETVELPSATEAQEAASGEPSSELATSGAPGAAMLGAATSGGTQSGGAGSSAAMMATGFEVIRGLVEASVRRGTFTIYWKERAHEEQIAVQTYFTDPSNVQAMGSLAAALGAATSTGGN